MRRGQLLKVILPPFFLILLVWFLSDVGVLSGKTTKGIIGDIIIFGTNKINDITAFGRDNDVSTHDEVSRSKNVSRPTGVGRLSEVGQPAAVSQPTVVGQPAVVGEPAVVPGTTVVSGQNGGAASGTTAEVKATSRPHLLVPSRDSMIHVVKNVSNTNLKCHNTDATEEARWKAVGPTKKLLLFKQFPKYYEMTSSRYQKMLDECAYKCDVTEDERRFNEADLVVIYSHYKYANDLKVVPEKRPGQKWAFYAAEPPPLSYNEAFGAGHWHNKFDWTISYRYDSDFWQGYLKVRPKETETTQEKKSKDIHGWKEKFANKTKMVAWFVSHCNTQSRREEYVAELSKYIQVDVYGKCEKLKCEDRGKCARMLDTDYKFYLSFENSFCVDYVTEKFRGILEMNTLIPVVRSGADYKKYFPPNSVIDTKDFSSPENLAKYLTQLANNEEEYTKRLQWSWDYDVFTQFAQPVCHLCQELHTPRPVACVYQNISNWWFNGTCHAPPDLSFKAH